MGSFLSALNPASQVLYKLLEVSSSLAECFDAAVKGWFHKSDVRTLLNSSQGTG